MDYTDRQLELLELKVTDYKWLHQPLSVQYKLYNAVSEIENIEPFTYDESELFDYSPMMYIATNPDLTVKDSIMNCVRAIKHGVK